VPEPAKSKNVDDIPTLASEPGEPEWKPIRLHFGIDGFGVNAWRASEPGQVVIERHTEIEDSDTKHQELYFVARGHARFTVDGETMDAPAGTLVYVPDPASVREATAVEADTLVLIVGGAPGQPFTPSGWELKHA
jgi:hypothetical protein